MKLKFTHAVVALALAGLVPAVSVASLETMEQKFSYALGVRYAQQFKAQDVQVDGTAFGAAVSDVFKGGDLQLTDEQMQKAMKEGREALAKAKQEKANERLAAGRKFLDENKAKEGITVLPSGLQYQVIEAGSGESPSDTAKVTVNYRGATIDGKEFDSSYKRGKPAVFPVKGVIPGFSEALKLMKAGAKWKVFIPSELGYGPRGAGSSIGPNETLIFDLELISFENEPAPKAEEKKAESK